VDRLESLAQTVTQSAQAVAQSSKTFTQSAQTVTQSAQTVTQSALRVPRSVSPRRNRFGTAPRPDLETPASSSNNTAPPPATFARGAANSRGGTALAAAVAALAAAGQLGDLKRGAWLQTAVNLLGEQLPSSAAPFGPAPCDSAATAATATAAAATAARAATLPRGRPARRSGQAGPIADGPLLRTREGRAFAERQSALSQQQRVGPREGQRSEAEQQAMDVGRVAERLVNASFSLTIF
jgi:hypothetical protein